MADSQTIKNGGAAAVSIISALGFNNTDLIIGTTPPANDTDITRPTSATSGTTCSAIRYNSKLGGYEVLLVANEGGKYYVANSTDNFAFSRASKSGENLND